MILKHLDTGEVFSGETYDDIVRLMWSSQWFRDPTRKKYMQGVARRHKVWTGTDGKKIRTGTTKKFIEDLLNDAFFVRVDPKGVA